MSAQIQYFWEQLVVLCGNNSFNLYVIGPYIAFLMVYWGVGGALLMLDYIGPSNFLVRFKIQQISKDWPLKKSRLIDLIKVVGFNHLCTFPVLVLMYWFSLWRGIRPLRELPSLPEAVIHLGVMTLASEAWYYYAHRLFHEVPFLYKTVHKKHHTWVSPVAFAASYCHPLEQILINAPQFIVGPLILNPHISLSWILLVTGTLGTLERHSGYSTVAFHDLHHLKRNCNYGGLGILDKIHGTYFLPKRKN